uniref:Dual specificity phosphatase 22b n=1 Tax=Amphiprion percula TaxID=161767 RepID=A0A3P8S387_AMPPE
MCSECHSESAVLGLSAVVPHLIFTDAFPFDQNCIQCSLFLQVLPDLYLGNFKDARDREQLARNNITHILSIHDSAAPILQEMTYLCISAADLPTQNLTQHFKESIMFMHESRLKGEGCLVHCLAGVSRSVTLVVAYIMTVTGLGWQEALAAVRVARPCAGPNLGFQRQLQEFETTQAEQFRDWMRTEYKENPFNDEADIRDLLARASNVNDDDMRFTDT